VEVTTAGWPASKPAASSRCHQASPASKLTGTRRRPLRDAEPEFDQALPLPSLRSRLVDLEYPQAGGDLRLTLGEGVQAGAENDVLADTPTGLFNDQILDEAGTGHDGCAEGAREVRVHVRTLAPTIPRGDQSQADLVFKHMRRWIDLDVQGSPQGNPHCRAVGRRGSPIVHEALSPFDQVRSECRRTNLGLGEKIPAAPWWSLRGFPLE